MKEAKTFWLVWREGGNTPTSKHPNRQLASAEAERLARCNKGAHFVILRAVAAVCVSEINWVELPAPTRNNEEENPF